MVNEFGETGEFGELDSETYARLGEGLLVAMETLVNQYKNQNRKLEREIKSREEVWQGLYGEDVPLGELLLIAFQRKMSRLRFERKILLKVLDSWDSSNQGII